MKEVVAYVVSSHGYSERRACQVTSQHRSTQRKPSTRDPRTEVRQRMHEIVATRIRYGYRRVHVMLKREGWQIGRNVVYRLYREEGLVLRTKQPRRRKMIVHREARCKPQRPNEAWSLDFVHDQLSNGQKFRMLTVVDVFSREALAIEVGQRLRGEHVVEVLNRLVRQRGAPKYLFADNGGEFTGRLVDLWAYHHGVRIDFSRPGYSMRWKIELFFKILKSGCNAEKLKLRTAERLVNLIAIFCILGWRIFWMTMINRALPNESPTCVLTAEEIVVIDRLAARAGRTHAAQQRLSTYLVEIARLGGYLARNHDPPPGNMIMWRGWSRLMDIQLGATLAPEGDMGN